MSKTNNAWAQGFMVCFLVVLLLIALGIATGAWKFISDDQCKKANWIVAQDECTKMQYPTVNGQICADSTYEVSSPTVAIIKPGSSFTLDDVYETLENAYGHLNSEFSRQNLVYFKIQGDQVEPIPNCHIIKKIKDDMYQKTDCEQIGNLWNLNCVYWNETQEMIINEVKTNVSVWGPNPLGVPLANCTNFDSMQIKVTLFTGWKKLECKDNVTYQNFVKGVYNPGNSACPFECFGKKIKEDYNCTSCSLETKWETTYKIFEKFNITADCDPGWSTGPYCYSKGFTSCEFFDNSACWFYNFTDESIFPTCCNKVITYESDTCFSNREMGIE